MYQSYIDTYPNESVLCPWASVVAIVWPLWSLWCGTMVEGVAFDSRCWWFKLGPSHSLLFLCCIKICRKVKHKESSNDPHKKGKTKHCCTTGRKWTNFNNVSQDCKVFTSAMLFYKWKVVLVNGPLTVALVARSKLLFPRKNVNRGEKKKRIISFCCLQT